MKKKTQETLNSIFKDFHKPEYLKMDPLICVHEYKKEKDIEVAGLISSALAYGRVEIIIRNIKRIFKIISNQPAEFAVSTDFQSKIKAFENYKHRFNDALDVALLFETTSLILRRFGSIGDYFSSLDGIDDDTVERQLDCFTNGFKSLAESILGKRKESFQYLFPSPSSGSACKRMNMYLRWMVRKNDLIDFGIWKDIYSSRLIMPVDTHVASMATKLDLTGRKNPDWKMAVEITESLREIDPEDPIKYDFSLCRAGMIDFREEAV